MIDHNNYALYGDLSRRVMSVLGRFAPNQAVYSLADHTRWPGDLAPLEVAEVWGVGPRWARRLNGVGITTAEALRRAGPAWIARTFNVVLARTVRELNGRRCLALDS